MKVTAIINIKQDVLDRQGKVIHKTLYDMGFQEVNDKTKEKNLEMK